MQSFNDQANPPPLRYGCVCSGISAPTLAAKNLGWKTAFFSEIEAFPRALLKHHYPATPLHGDFTTIQKDTYGTVDLLIGGTPCQSFSVAGKRLGLDDPCGNLALEYVALAGRLDAQWLVFENVPGLLSSGKPKGEDFATFISAATGHEYRPPATGWQNAGIAEGKSERWGIAWRILDAQYFGVAQRRRRMFVIGYRGNWRPAAAVLLEPNSMRGDSPPSRKKESPVAALTANGVGTCGADDNQAQAGRLIRETSSGLTSGGSRSRGRHLSAEMAAGGHLISSTGHISHCLNAGGMARQDYETETLIAHSLRGEGFDASGDGTGRGTPLVPVAFSCKDDGRDSTDNLSPTLRSMNHHSSHANGGGQVAVCYPILEPGSRTGTSTTDPRAGIGIGDPQAPMFTLQARKQHGIAVSLRGREGGATAELGGDTMPALRASQGGGDKPHVLLPSAVRRLTPEECEALQGMPQYYTRIPWRSKPAEQCPDGPRYKAIGNSMAVPCVRWILTRLNFVHHTLRRMERAA